MLRHILHDPFQGCLESVLFPNRLSVCWSIPNNERHSSSSTAQFERHLQWPVANELRRSCFGTGDTLANSQSNSTLTLLPSPFASGLTAAVHNISSSKKSRLAASPRFLQTDDVAGHFLVHVEDLRRSSHAVLPIHSHRPHPWVAMTRSLLRSRSRSLLACRRAARRFVLPLRLFFRAGNFFLFINICTYTSVLQFLPPFAPEVLVSRGGFGSPSPRRLAHLTHPS